MLAQIDNPVNYSEDLGSRMATAMPVENNFDRAPAADDESTWTETLHQEPEPSNEDQNGILGFIRNKFPVYGYMLTSTLHAIAGITSIKNFLFSESMKKAFDKFTVRLSKSITSITYAALAIEAWKKNKMFDFIARMLDPLFVPWMNLEDIHLARGMSAGLTLVDFAQNRKVGEHHKDRKSNLLANVKTALEVGEEIIQGGIGRARKIFVKQKNDQGHTKFFAGLIIMLGSLLGVAFGANQRNFMNKLGGVIRNYGGIMGDITMILAPDEHEKLSGAFYVGNAIIDAVQRFLPKSVIDPVNHFNMILNNLGTYFYGQISRKRHDKTFKDYN